MPRVGVAAMPTCSEETITTSYPVEFESVALVPGARTVVTEHTVPNGPFVLHLVDPAELDDEMFHLSSRELHELIYKLAIHVHNTGSFMNVVYFTCVCVCSCFSL